MSQGPEALSLLGTRSSEMAPKWEPCSLDALVDIKHGFAFDGAFISDEPGGDVLVTPGNFAIGGGFKADKLKYYRGPVPDGFVLQQGDLVVTMTDLSKHADTLGYPALVPTDSMGGRFLHNQRIGKVVIKKPGVIDRKYLFYLMRGQKYRNEVLASATGTAIKHTSPERIRRFSFLCPPIGEQRAIAHILATLDDKIDLYRRMNETLEAMARALFKSWFVDFDPVRAKAEGRDPGLPNHLADLFPDRFEDSELGEIPAGWKIVKLGSLLELAYGKALKAEDRRKGDFPVYGSNGQVGWHNEPLVAGPGIVVGRKGNPGIATWVPSDFFPIDTTFYVTPTAACSSLHFLFHALRSHDLASLGADSAVPGLNRNLAYMSQQVCPAALVLMAFERFADVASRRLHSSNEECRALVAARDALLPRLISGALRAV